MIIFNAKKMYFYTQINTIIDMYRLSIVLYFPHLLWSKLLSNSGQKGNTWHKGNHIA